MFRIKESQINFNMAQLKIGYDARMITHSGIGTYIRNTLNHLTSFSNLEFTLFGNLEKISQYQTRKVLADFPIYSLKEQIFFPRILSREKKVCDLIHFPHYNIPLSFTNNVVVTIHDLIHLTFPPSKFAYLYARTMLEAACRKAKLIITVSENTKKDILKWFKIPDKKIRVIYSGAGNEWIQTSKQESSRDYSNLGRSKEYILYVGNLKPSKNINTLIQGFSIAQKKIKDLNLILAGKNFMPHLLKSSLHPQISILGEISLAQLRDLYKNAKLFVFPSSYEGFGFPPLEAMQFGIPVISSCSSSLPEILGDSALFFNPQDPRELADCICECWNKEEVRKNLKIKGFENLKRFSWEKCATETAKVYSELF